MASPDPSPQDKLVALLGPSLVAVPWIILYFGRWRLYVYVLVGFALIMALINSRELTGRVRNWRADPKSKELRKAA
jgi:hypothetical protein